MRSTFLIICSLLFAAVAIGAVYKWVDDEGNVHYGDTPPNDHEQKTIEIAPAPPPKAIIDEQDRAKQPEAEEEVLPDGETDEVPEDEIEGAKQPVSRYATDIKCFAPLTEAWGGRIADTREGVTRQPFKNDEHDQLLTLFDALEGRWNGRIEDITCHSPGAEPPSKRTTIIFASLPGGNRSRDSGLKPNWKGRGIPGLFYGSSSGFSLALMVFASGRQRPT